MALPPTPKIPTWLLGIKLLTNPLDCLDTIYKQYGDIITIMNTQFAIKKKILVTFLVLAIR
jgi:hypothetical protein